ncbi:MAG: tetratricopeptide repeat protein [Sphingomonadales bacterium]
MMLLVCIGVIIAGPSYAGADNEHAYKFSVQISRPEQLRHANELYRQGKFEESLPWYRRVLEKELPRYTSYEAHTNYCAALIEIGAYTRAKVQCEQAVALLPWKWSARFNLGLSYHHLGLYEAAISEFELILKKTPTHAKANKALKESRHALKYYAPYVRKNALLGGQAI